MNNKIENTVNSLIKLLNLAPQWRRRETNTIWRIGGRDGLWGGIHPDGNNICHETKNAEFEAGGGCVSQW